MFWKNLGRSAFGNQAREIHHPPQGVLRKSRDKLISAHVSLRSGSFLGKQMAKAFVEIKAILRSWLQIDQRWAWQKHCRAVTSPSMMLLLLSRRGSIVELSRSFCVSGQWCFCKSYACRGLQVLLSVADRLISD